MLRCCLLDVGVCVVTAFCITDASGGSRCPFCKGGPIASIVDGCFMYAENAGQQVALMLKQVDK